MKREVVGGSGKAQEPSKFGCGTREVAKAIGDCGAPGKATGHPPMKIRIPNHPDKSRVK